MNPLQAAIAAAALEPPQPLDGGWQCRYRFDAGFPGFAGHFPGYPVLPAVVQVLAAVALIGAGRGRAAQLAGIDNAKFLIQLRPGDEISVRCQAKCVAGRPAWDAQLSVAAGVAASFVLQLAEEAPC